MIIANKNRKRKKRKKVGKQVLGEEKGVGSGEMERVKEEKKKQDEDP